MELIVYFVINLW